MNEYVLLDLLPTSASNDFDFTASYNGNNYYIFSTEYFLLCVRQHFTSAKIALMASDYESAKSELTDVFNLWKAYRSDTYARRAYALSVDFEPLENYDSHEERSGNIKRTLDTADNRTLDTKDNRTLDTKDNRTIDTKNETTYGHTVNTTDGLYGVNSSASVNANTSTSTDGGKDSTTDTGTDNVAHTGTDNVAHTGTDNVKHTGTDTTADTYTLRRHGNIGVTTSQQMLESDLDLLRRDFPFTAVCDFIDRYTYYIGGLDL